MVEVNRRENVFIVLSKKADDIDLGTSQATRAGKFFALDDYFPMLLRRCCVAGFCTEHNRSSKLRVFATVWTARSANVFVQKRAVQNQQMSHVALAPDLQENTESANLCAYSLGPALAWKPVSLISRN